MMFRWTPRRDRELQALRADLFTFKDCAAILGRGCTAAMCRARLAELQANEIPERGVRYEPQAPLHPVIGPDPASTERPVTEGGRPCTVVPRPVPARPGKIPLPRFGEMEKRYDSVTRARLAEDG